MRQVLSRAALLVRQPAVLVVALLLAAGGSGLALLPLFEVPGLELGLALSVGMGLLGGSVGVAAAAQERRLPPPGTGQAPAESPAQRAWRATATALLLNTALLLPPLAASTLKALLGTRCDPLALAFFYPLLTLPSAALASATGTLCGFATLRPARAHLLYAGLLLGSGAATAWPLVAGPQVFAANHFLGWLPGPLYDEALALTPGLLWFRLETLLLALLLLLATALCLEPRQVRLGRPRRSPALLVPLALAALAVLALEARGTALGTRMTEQALAERLGGMRETPHFRLHYPRGMPREQVERMVRDLEFRYAQLERFFGEVPQGPVRVWLYRSAEEKQALVGAGRTQFAKPWRLELHINAQAFPHRSLKHELAHVLAAPYGSGPFHVTTRLGLWPLMGIIEGLAVAADDAVQGDLTLHQWAAGMRRQGLAPDLRKLVGPEGFYQSAPSRAYTLVGSFLRYLGDTYGAQRLRTLYAHGDFQAAYGQPLEALATQWEQWLDAQPLDEAAASRAFVRFRTGSLFARTCAREVARLQEEAGGMLAADPEQALALYQRAAHLQPGEPSWLLGQATALQRLERLPEAAEVLSQVAGQVQGRQALEAEVALAQADTASRQGQVEEARAFLQRVLSLASSPEVARTAQVRLAALESPERATPIAAYFREEREELRLLHLARGLQAAPEDPYLHYLMGRRLEQVGAPGLALSYLARAAAGGLPGPLHREALRLRIQAAYLAGDCAAVRQGVEQLSEQVDAALRATAREWLQRCDFEQQSFKGPLVPGAAFR